MENFFIETKNLTRRYGNVVALNGVSFGIRKGEIFGILGPNGAGKTTLIEMLEGIYLPDEGTIAIEGVDKIYDNIHYKKIMGVQLQNTSIHDNLRVYEVLRLFSLFHQVPFENALRLLRHFHLESKKNELYRNLSGGEARTVQLILTFFHNPQIVFLDEPTTGLDPIARKNFWEFVRQNKQANQTILLTTHYVEEAEKICDRVAILDKGMIVRMDTPANLVETVIPGHKIVLRCEKSLAMEKDHGITKIDRQNSVYTIYTSDYVASLKYLLDYLEKTGIAMSGLALEKATLEDVYFSLLGNIETIEATAVPCSL